MKRNPAVMAASVALAFLTACGAGTASTVAPASSSPTAQSASVGTTPAAAAAATSTVGTTAAGTSTVGTTAAGTAGSRRDLPVLVVHPLTGEADFAVIEPTEMAYSIDVNAVIKDITWASWTATGATGKGSRVHDDCVPDCASGKVTLIPTVITLADPVGGQFTSLTETVGGKAQTLTGTGLIEGAGVNPVKLPVPASDPGAGSSPTPTTIGPATSEAPTVPAGPTSGPGATPPGSGYNDPDLLGRALLAEETAKGIAAKSVTCVFTAPGSALCQLVLTSTPYPIPARVAVSPDGKSYKVTSSG